MDLRAHLGQLILQITSERPRIYFETYFTEFGQKHRATLHVNTEKWESHLFDSVEEAKNFVLQMAYKDVNALKTELGVRVLLHLPLVCRNQPLIGIRTGMRAIKSMFIEKVKPDLIDLVQEMEVIVGKLEEAVVKEPFCKIPSSSTAEYKSLYGLTDGGSRGVPRMEAAIKADEKAAQFGIGLINPDNCNPNSPL